jgi:xanthine dehydrogenase accessory factor
MTPWPDWPVFGLENDLLGVARTCLERGEPFALATLVRTFGPSPRPVGSEMLVLSDGRAHGYLSGGCVEAAVAHEALACLRDGRPRLLDYGLGSDVVDIQLPCGGRIHILVRAVQDPAWWVSTLQQGRLLRQRVDVEIDLATGEMRTMTPDAAERPGTFIQRYVPATRLILVGSDPVTLATARLAKWLGMDVVIWRPNGPEAPPEGWTLDGYLRLDVPSGVEALPLDHYTAVYCLSHDMAVDVDVLRRALASSAFCVGVLGSRRKQATRRRRLEDAGVAPAQCARLLAPAGLSIGAASPQEIALSIVAEIVAKRSPDAAHAPERRTDERIASPA